MRENRQIDDTNTQQLQCCVPLSLLLRNKNGDREEMLFCCQFLWLSGFTFFSYTQEISWFVEWKNISLDSRLKAGNRIE